MLVTGCRDLVQFTNATITDCYRKASYKEHHVRGSAATNKCTQFTCTGNSCQSVTRSYSAVQIYSHTSRLHKPSQWFSCACQSVTIYMCFHMHTKHKILVKTFIRYQQVSILPLLSGSDLHDKFEYFKITTRVVLKIYISFHVEYRTWVDQLGSWGR